MADWLTQTTKIPATKVATKTPTNGGDWLSSKTGTTSTYKPNQLVSDIKPISEESNKVSAPTKSLFSKISDTVTQRLNSVFNIRTEETEQGKKYIADIPLSFGINPLNKTGKNKIVATVGVTKKKDAKLPLLKELFLPTSSGVEGQTFRKYVGETVSGAVNAIKGTGKLTPAYMAYRAVIGKPVTPKEYVETVANTGLDVLSTLWRVDPIAPAFGATMSTIKALRQKAEGKLTWDDVLNAPMKGINEQPGFGEVFTDNVKIAKAIDVVFLVGMFSKGFAKKKLDRANLKAEEINRVSKTLGVKPNATMEEISKAFKEAVKKYPDTFTANPNPTNLALRTELTNAFNILKKTKWIDKQYATAYEFLNQKFGGKGLVGKESKVEQKLKELESGVKPTVTKTKPQIKEIAKVETLGKETTLYRGAKDQTIDVTRPNGITGGVSMSIDRKTAQRFADKVGGTVAEYKLPADARVVNHSFLETLPKNEVQQYIKDNNIDAVRFDVPLGTKGEAEIRIVNDKILQQITTPTETKNKIKEEVVSENQKKLLEEATKRGYEDKNPLANIYNVKQDLLGEQMEFNKVANSMIEKYKDKTTEKQNLYDVMSTEDQKILKEASDKSDRAFELLKSEFAKVQEKPQISAKQTPLSPTEEGVSPQAQKEVSPTDKFKSRVMERMKNEYPEFTESVFLDKVTFDNEFEKATNLIVKDKQKAYDIAMGKETATEAESVATNIALVEKALDEENYKLAGRLIDKRTRDQSKRGQAIVLEKASVTDNSVSRYVKELISIKMDKLGDRYLSSLTKYKETPKERVNKIVDKKVAELENKIKNKKLDTKTALSLLDELTCI